ncbi:DoxX family membrane protein [Halogeometricum sp. S1BR25-6]|uniref:DoxX family membrane protein n=1 Tax=Halogeometricum salsisoli TaxID=2950536 RepID=A0ABU2GCE8_9EURY|nr:DoxX family membrane protein [Halogeometricum sp. S1BR25-6]MDS0298487.1 DoxX family membrane protein [Halogeometricum sp. S1BR25-6]
MLNRLLFIFARIAFGAKFAHDGYDNLASTDDMVAYADSVGVPFADVLVPVASFLLFAGGILLALGLAPLLGVVAIATFLLGVTPQMHDFWNMEGDQRDEELDAFLRNASFLGAAVAFAVAIRERKANLN